MINTPGFMKYMVNGLKYPACRKGSDHSIRAAAQTIAGYMQDFREDSGLGESIDKALAQ
jgi:hypothetical protein